MRHLSSLLLILFCTPFGLSAQSSDTVRVCTYNLLQFGADDTDRVDEFRMILNKIRPNILSVQEVLQSHDHETGGATLFQDSVASLLDVPLSGRILWDSNSHEQVMLFIDTTSLQFLSGRQITTPTAPRSQSAFILRVRATNDTITVLVAKWMEGESKDDERVRLREAETAVVELARLELDSVSFQHIIAAELNVSRYNEPGYFHLFSGGVRFSDPLACEANVNDDSLRAPVHTQSTRVREFGGGAGGGLHNRFDQILYSPRLRDIVRRYTYTALGNDGQHFRDSINVEPNTAVSAEMAQALHNASDHLPVFVDIAFGDRVFAVDYGLPSKLDLSSE